MPPEDRLTPETVAQHAELAAFTAQISEVAPVVADSVLGKRIGLDAPTLLATSDADIQEAFGALRHIAVEARIALSESEAYLATLLLPIAAVAAILDQEIDADALSDETAAPVLEPVQRAASEFVDLLTLMLFTDSPIRGEITVSDVRLDGIEESLGMVLDTAGGGALFRVDVTLLLPEQEGAAVTLLIPEALLTGLMQGLGRGEAAEAIAEPEPDAGAAAAGAVLDGLADDEDDDDEELIPIAPLRFPELPGEGAGPAGPAQPLDLILDVSMRVSVELGRASMTVQELLALGPGSVVELDKLAGEPVDILVNDRLIARGEVVMVDENFGVRVTEILTPGAALEQLGQAA